MKKMLMACLFAGVAFIGCSGGGESASGGGEEAAESAPADAAPAE